ncbi:C2H2-type domain-containing protein [Psidium guajava]|nr:C2H2-type domain-containing protein [Psidium guajava]
MNAPTSPPVAPREKVVARYDLKDATTCQIINSGRQERTCLAHLYESRTQRELLELFFLLLLLLLLFFFLDFLFMALLTFLPDSSSSHKQKLPPPSKRKRTKHHQKQHQHQHQHQHEQDPKLKQKLKQKQKPPASPPQSSWDQFKSLLTCKQVEGSAVHDPSKHNNKLAGSSCSSICSFRDVVHGNTRVVHRADNSPEGSSVGQEAGLLSSKAGAGSSSSRSLAGSTRTHGGGGGGGSSRGMQFRKLSGCYECHMIVDPSRYPYTPRSTICACSQCGEVFPKLESLELHQAVRHAVSELGPEDSGRHIVEIIFKSSWLKKDNPICKIERILKVHNTQRTIQRFEDCRDAVKTRALASTRKDPRCAADGNELLRFHCTTLACALGSGGSTSLCGSVPGCGVCTVVRHGFHARPQGGGGGGGGGVCTTASSGRAHDSLRCADGRRAMLVCRVIAGRVRRVAEEGAPQPGEGEGPAAGGSYDSVAGHAGAYSNLEELFVFNPKAILPCFVVIYKALQS